MFRYTFIAQQLESLVQLTSMYPVQGSELGSFTVGRGVFFSLIFSKFLHHFPFHFVFIFLKIENENERKMNEKWNPNLSFEKWTQK